MVMALRDPEYYAERYRQTAELRRRLVESLMAFHGIQIVPSVANFVLCHLPSDGPDASTVVSRCKEYGVFLRDASNIGQRMGSHALRIAVKDRDSNCRIVDALTRVLQAKSVSPRMHHRQGVQ